MAEQNPDVIVVDGVEYPIQGKPLVQEPVQGEGQITVTDYVKLPDVQPVATTLDKSLTTDEWQASYLATSIENAELQSEINTLRVEHANMEASLTSVTEALEKQTKALEICGQMADEWREKFENATTGGGVVYDSMGLPKPPGM